MAVMPIASQSRPKHLVAALRQLSNSICNTERDISLDVLGN